VKLFYTPTSPYARKVRVVAAEKGLGDRLELVACDLQAPDEEFLAANPAGKVPTLLGDAGQAIYDSPVICEWLDSVIGGPQLIPESGPDRWAVRRGEALADAIMDDAVTLMLERRRPEGQRNNALEQARTAAIGRCLDALEREIPAWPQLTTLAHIGAGCALGYLDLRLPDLDWRAGRLRLSEWFGDFSGRPSMRATEPS